MKASSPKSTKMVQAVAKMDGMTSRWDVSRVAAQVVSGIGFIGAGTIIFRK